MPARKTTHSAKAVSDAIPPIPQTQPSHSHSILAFVDADIVSGKDEFAREQLLNNLSSYRSNGVSPLWVNWLRHRADLRFVCLVRDFGEFNDFILDVVRSVDGVRETNTLLSFGGHADLDTLLDLELEVDASQAMVAGNVLIDVQPGMDRDCFQALLNLPRHPDVRWVLLLNCYHNDNADLMMLLLARNEAILNGYVMSWIRSAPGVVDTELENFQDWRWLAASDDIIELCEIFFRHNRVSEEKRKKR